MNSLRGKGMSVDKATFDEAWSEYWSTGGFEFVPNGEPAATRRFLNQEAELQERLKAVHKGYNRLLRKVAAAVDEAWPPDQILPGNTAPGDIVRGFIVDPGEEASKDAATAARREDAGPPRT